jgi:hypothetical protein
MMRLHLGESPVQQLLEQSLAFSVSIDVVDTCKLGVLRSLVASFEASDFSDSIESG